MSKSNQGNQFSGGNQKNEKSSDKDQTWKTDKHIKEHKVTKIIHTK